MKQWLANAESWFNDREKREQYIFSVVIFVVIAWLGFIFLIEPSVEQRTALQRQVQQITTQTQSIQQQVTGIRTQLQANPDIELNTRQRQLASRSNQLSMQLDNLAEFVAPDELLDWLQAMLVDSENAALTGDEALTLRSFDTSAPEPFLADSPGGTVYQHNVQVELEGSYFAVRDYLQRLQDLPFGFYWQELDYQVRAYPMAEVRLRLYTLSQQAGGNDEN